MQVRYIGGSRPGEMFQSADGTVITCLYNEAVTVLEEDLPGLLAQVDQWEAADEEAEEYVPVPAPGPFASVKYDLVTKVLYERDGVTEIEVSGVDGDPGPQGEQGPAGPAGPASFTPAGEWTSGLDYTEGQWVTHAGSSYAATVDIPDSLVAPPSDPDWQLIAAAGADGADGATKLYTYRFGWLNADDLSQSDAVWVPDGEQITSRLSVPKSVGTADCTVQVCNYSTGTVLQTLSRTTGDGAGIDGPDASGALSGGTWVAPRVSSRGVIASFGGARSTDSDGDGDVTASVAATSLEDDQIIAVTRVWSSNVATPPGGTTTLDEDATQTGVRRGIYLYTVPATPVDLEWSHTGTGSTNTTVTWVRVRGGSYVAYADQIILTGPNPAVYTATAPTIPAAYAGKPGVVICMVQGGTSNTTGKALPAGFTQITSSGRSITGYMLVNDLSDIPTFAQANWRTDAADPLEWVTVAYELRPGGGQITLDIEVGAV